MIFAFFIRKNSIANPVYQIRYIAKERPEGRSFVYHARTLATARAVFSRISSGVPFIIQLPPQAMVLSKARYSVTLSSEMPPVGKKSIEGNAAASALMVASPPKLLHGKNLTMVRPCAMAAILGARHMRSGDQFSNTR